LDKTITCITNADEVHGPASVILTQVRFCFTPAGYRCCGSHRDYFVYVIRKHSVTRVYSNY